MVEEELIFRQVEAVRPRWVELLLLRPVKLEQLGVWLEAWVLLQGINSEVEGDARKTKL
jgi:hypothetical protein